MFKLKNFKILLLLMLFAFAGQSAWADKGDTDYWYFSNAKVETLPTGAGKVYAGTQTDAANPTKCVAAPHTFVGKSHKSQFPYKWYVNTVPTDTKKYKFIRWEDGNGNVLSTDQNPESPFMDNEGIKGGGNNTGESGDGATNPGTITVNYIAVYEEIINQYVSVESQNPEYLTATIDMPENQIGDEVTLWAYPNNYNSKFTGWAKDGVIVSMENPWTFTINESNAGTYIATYKTGYNFYRFRNKETSRRFNAISDQGSITNFSSLQLVSGDVATYSAGSVVQISMHHISGGNVYDFIMQNSHTSAYYNESAGEYITMAINSVDNTWTINPNRQPVYMADENGANVSSSPYNDLDKSKWYIDPIDKDLETKENYFSLDPNKLVEVHGKYYTTLRTSWNILFNPEQMTPYIVKSVDETAGTFEMEAITGNIIPAGTPVIIETKSSDVLENRMVPTLTNAASGAVPSGNLLQASTKYFPNQAAPVSNCKGLYKNADGQLAFGGNALNTVNGNEAYLSVANEVVLPLPIETVTLAQLCADGFEGRPYCIKDSLLIVYSKDNSIWVKDNNKSICKDIYNGEQLYLIGRETGSEMQPNQVPQNEYDQSNWLEVQLTGIDNYDVTQSIGYYVNANAIKGTFSNKLSPTMTGVKLQLADIIDADEAVNYNANYYCPASFFGSQQGAVAGVQHNYFFVKPKPQELANVVWAMWNNTEQKMVLHGDKHGFQGKFRIDMELNNDPTFVPADSTAYNFLAIIRKQELRDIGYMVYPLNISSSVITAVTDIAAKQVVGVTYYNVTGLSSERPFEGVNIVVTRYSDGSTSTAKRIF